jgi:hypothetical protein
MNRLTAKRMLETYMQTNWIHTPVAYENVNEENTAVPGEPLLPDGTQNYIAIRVHHTYTATITVPAYRFRNNGILFCAVCVLDGTGTQESDRLSDLLIDLLESKEIPGLEGLLRIHNIAGTPIYRPSPNWFVTEPMFNFSFDRCRP